MNNVNIEQQQAIETVQGALLVIAGAGSGKTRVVTLRIVHLLSLGVPAHNILGLTFTNKAAGEMKSRVEKLTHNHVLIATFHSLGAKILRESIEVLGYRRSFTIYDEEDVEKLLKLCLEELKIEGKKEDIKGIRQMISKAKNHLFGPGESDTTELDGRTESLFNELYRLYQQKLKDANAVDFDDLLYLPAKLFREHPDVLEKYQEKWQYLLIDEYQDTNMVQYTLVRMLVAKYGNICVVGDPDQSIYSWRGANIQNILNFEKDYPGARVIRLEQNYRSRSNILDAANALISHNENRLEKNLWSDRGPGEKIRLFLGNSEKEEADFISDRIRAHQREGLALKEMAVLYRTNAQSRAFDPKIQILLKRP